MLDLVIRLAQAGSRLVQSTADKYVGDFFARVGDIVTGAVPIKEKAAVVAVAAEGKEGVAAGRSMAPADDKNRAHLRRLSWALLAIIVALIGDVLATNRAALPAVGRKFSVRPSCGQLIALCRPPSSGLAAIFVPWPSGVLV